jgi:protease PrsW
MQKYIAAFLVSQTIIFTVWSGIEEVMKYVAARLTVLGRREDDEPIDAVMYMVTVALGFAALENALFLLSPLAGETALQTFMTGNLRFVGATLLHVLSSAVIGVAIALAFYKSRGTKIVAVGLGVILAIALHSGFNFLILNTAEEHLLRTFGIVWLGLAALLAVLEYVKRIKKLL